MGERARKKPVTTELEDIPTENEPVRRTRLEPHKAPRPVPATGPYEVVEEAPIRSWTVVHEHGDEVHEHGDGETEHSHGGNARQKSVPLAKRPLK